MTERLDEQALTFSTSRLHVPTACEGGRQTKPNGGSFSSQSPAQRAVSLLREVFQMKRVQAWASLSLLMLLVTWASIGRASAGETVPIRGWFIGTVQVTPLSASEPLFRIDTVAVGPVSHAGKAVAAWAVPEVVLDLVNRRLIV